MANRNEIVTTIGLRHVRVAKRDTDSMIAVPVGTVAGTAYNGLRAGGATALTVTIADPNRVQARGDDRAYHTFNLPPTETPTGELRVSKSAFDLMALITGTLVWGSPPFRKVGMATDQQGLEPALVMWGSNQGVDTDDNSAFYGQQVWNTYVFLNALAAPKPAAKEDQNVGEVTYAITANDSTVDECGTAFTALLNGFTKAPYIAITTLGEFMLDAFVGNASEVAFVLSQAVLHSGGLCQVYVNGVLQVGGGGDYTLAGRTVTFDSAPAALAKIIVEYDYDS